MRTLKWGMSGDDVASLQRALAARHGYTGRVDGVFGSSTRQAVITFQRANGLPADGIAGAATQAALGLGDAPAPGQPPGSTARSLHIGLNGVDPGAYAGWPGTLTGCENDARSMLRIAQAEGCSTRTLFTREASSARVLAAIADAAAALTDGGFFLLTYSGHGGQIPNKAGSDDEADGRDETWVLYDRMLIDDELSDALSAFAPGVNIVVLSDSCHSGSVNRRFMSTPRLIPDAVLATVLAQAGDLYADLKQSTGRDVISARGLLLSACKDNQLAQETNGAGVFSARVAGLWANRTFQGSYTAFMSEIARGMPSTQTPQLSPFGTDPEPLATATPFAPGLARGYGPRSLRIA